MKISSVCISNYRSIDYLEIKDIREVLILVGKNNAGKSNIIGAVTSAFSGRVIGPNERNHEGNVVIGLTLDISDDDLHVFQRRAILSKYKKYDKWYEEFCEKIPSYNGDSVTFEYVCTMTGDVYYRDEFMKNNPYISEIFPKVYRLDNMSGITGLEDDILMFEGNEEIGKLRDNRCIFDESRRCSNRFDCIGLIEKKKPSELTLVESAKLFQYKLFMSNIDEFAGKVNRNFLKNGGAPLTISYEMNNDVSSLLKFETKFHNVKNKTVSNLRELSNGYRSIYNLSLLESSIDEKNALPHIIILDEPESNLHPKMQKVASDILYRLSKKNQIIFSTHSPHMLINFTGDNIAQVSLDKDYNTSVAQKPSLSRILDTLGYTASDLMGVDFVFFVEGKQDRTRLPMLLSKFYPGVDLNRISIISTNSCTNIKTYANLKYMNQLYIKDQFLMVRDGDGKDREALTKNLIGFYEDSKRVDLGYLPRVSKENVLVLRYYSLENYFLDPRLCVKAKVISSVDEFFDILYAKYVKYLYKNNSFKAMASMGIKIESVEDLKEHFEDILVYGRGHNLYDIFYGRFKKEKEEEVLKRYIEYADRETFADIIEKLDNISYFNARKVNTSE
ncbi:MAG: AAA family ATPase [Lachnospiraceae bacterium]|nr:AAA family ATPase [Lachnospiraceae bacterium]